VWWARHVFLVQQVVFLCQRQPGAGATGILGVVLWREELGGGRKEADSWPAPEPGEENKEGSRFVLEVDRRPGQAAVRKVELGVDRKLEWVAVRKAEPGVVQAVHKPALGRKLVVPVGRRLGPVGRRLEPVGRRLVREVVHKFERELWKGVDRRLVGAVGHKFARVVAFGQEGVP
jgi:hypothetical protein